jgi:protein-disulfide isomerase
MFEVRPSEQSMPGRAALLRDISLAALIVLIAVAATIAATLTQNHITMGAVAVEIPKGQGRIMGADDAPVTITLYADIACIDCHSALHTWLPQLWEHYIVPGQARFEYVPYGVARSPHGSGLLCAAEQGQLWAYQAQFVTQPDVTPQHLAKDLALDVTLFTGCLSSERIRLDAEALDAQARMAGMDGASALVINRKLATTTSFDDIQQVIGEVHDESTRIP